MEKQLPKYSSDYFFQKKNKYALLIPTLNEGARIQSELRKIKEQKICDLIDIFILDSNSTDNSVNDEFLKDCFVRARINIFEGKQGSAFRAGINEILEQNYEGIVTVDGNNKDSTDSIPDFIEKLDNGYDFIQGSRFLKRGFHKNTPLIRLFAVKFILTPWINLLSGFKYTETASAFRGYSKKLLVNANILRDCFVSYEFLWYMSVFAPKNNFKVLEIPTMRIYPKDKKTPTKINAKGNFAIIFQLIKLTLKKYGKY